MAPLPGTVAGPDGVLSKYVLNRMGTLRSSQSLQRGCAQGFRVCQLSPCRVSLPDGHMAGKSKGQSLPVDQCGETSAQKEEA